MGPSWKCENNTMHYRTFMEVWYRGRLYIGYARESAYIWYAIAGAFWAINSLGPLSLESVQPGIIVGSSVFGILSLSLSLSLSLYIYNVLPGMVSGCAARKLVCMHMYKTVGNT